jgi:alpha-L-rhamnosidase
LIEENYAALTKHINFLESRTKDNLFDTDLGDHESLDEKSKPLTASIFYYLHVRMMEEFAGILEKDNDKKRFAGLTEKIKQSIVAKFYDPASGKFEKGSQTTQIFALWSQIEKDGTQGKVINALVSEFEKKNWHVSTGIFGTKMLFDVLRATENNEMAYRIANQRDFPGWGYMVANGATTLWETWAASDNTYSKNHPMFGSVGEWFYRSLLGINASAPGFKKIIIKPQPAGDMKHAKGSYISPYGKIGSAWEITDGKFSLNAEIPVNTTAEIWLPLKYGENITEAGKVISGVNGLKMLREENGYAIFSAGSGSYTFTAAK